MLSIQIKKEGQVVQIYCDDEGIDLIIKTFAKLRGSGSHIHLSTTNEYQLSEKTPFGETGAIELIISHGGD